MSDGEQEPGGPARRRLSRRHLLLGGAAAGIGAAGALGVDLAVKAGAAAPAHTAEPVFSGSDTVPFFGVHQAGVDTVPQAHASFVALRLHGEVDRAGLRRLMRILTDDAARLTQGDAALADSEPELAVVPARLTVTFGFGAALVARAGGAAPGWLKPLPAFTVDRLEPAWTGGDLLLQIAADDPMTVAHATRMLLKDVRSFATVHWVQPGFRRSAGSEKPGTTMRNLFGQVDGTANPVSGTDDFDTLVWGPAGNPAWLAGGTGFVLRRISMDLDKWDRLDRSGRESALGRTLATGAPLTGEKERDEPDFAATTPLGFPVIPEYSHLRRARSEDRSQRIHRRGYNYDDTPTGTAVSNSGLLFVAFQADVDAQFVPIQQRLDTLDLLNQWITPIGSAVFAIPPGCTAGGFIGDTLL
ncbi:MAG: Dyp-type peroxidase [Ramlibacter sp.]|nr:Dyp-type peroxidase [Cryobacterium sp.]